MDQTYLVIRRSDTVTVAEGLTSADLVLWFWGRNVTQYVIYAGECPYRFFEGSLWWMCLILDKYPPERLRHALPLKIQSRLLSRYCLVGDATTKEQRTVWTLP